MNVAPFPSTSSFRHKSSLLEDSTCSFQLLSLAGKSGRASSIKCKMSSPSGLPQRTLGKTGLKVSVLGFGASPLGNVFGDVDEQDAISAVHEAIDLGINFFDVSPFYGATLAEKVLGSCLKGIPRDRFIISTKVGRYGEANFDFSAERVTRSVDESLQRLGLDYIDIIQCHDIEFTSLQQIVSETIPALQKLKAAGKVRFIGITGLPLKVFREVLRDSPPSSVDVVLSYCHCSLNDSSLLPLLPFLEEKGVGVISASPLSMGLLTPQGPPAWHPAPDELKSACRAAAALCSTQGWDLPTLALQFATTVPEVATTLVGMSCVQQVRQNVRAVLDAFDKDFDRSQIESVQAKLKDVQSLTWPSGLLENNDHI